MKITASDELQDLTGILETEVKKVLDERESLQLAMPDKFNVHLSFYDQQGSSAFVFKGNNSVPLVTLNLLPLTSDGLDKENEKSAFKVMNYLDLARDFFGLSSGSLMPFIYDPFDFMAHFENSFPKGSFKKFQNFFQERGVSHSQYKQFLLSEVDSIRQSIDALLPLLKHSFKLVDKSLRHEVDHVAFYDSDLYNIHSKTFDLYSASTKEFLTNENKTNSVAYANSGLVYLDSIFDTLPLMELRALFFDYVDYGKWDSVNFKEVKNKVYSAFTLGYIDSLYAETILNTLISKSWSENKMDRQTSNYLFQKLHDVRGSPDVNRYSVDLKEVDFSVVNDIWYHQLPDWKHRFAERGLFLVDLIGNLYENDSSVLGKSNSAKSFEDFLRITGSK